MAANMMLATSIQCHDPFIVLSYMLLARFLMLQRQAKESWLSFASAIREAEILGLHRLGPAPDERSQAESREAAMRQNIWMHLYFEASFHSLIIGQTPLIHDSFCDTAPPKRLLPANLDPTHFDLAAILRIRYDLSRIVNKALHIFLSDQHDMDSDALFRLDHELQTFRDSLPSPYSMDDDHTRFTSTRSVHAKDDDDSFRKIALHRFVLISLHLPHLRRGSAEPGFERSRQAAIQAAVADFQARQELRQRLEWPDHLATDRFVGGRFPYFHATSTLGICLLSEPNVERVHQLVSLLDEFLQFAQLHQQQQGVDPNRCVRQEMGIVSLIRARIKRKLDTDRSGRGHHNDWLQSPFQSLTTLSQRQTTGGHVDLEPFTANTALDSAQKTRSSTSDAPLPLESDVQNGTAQLTQASHPELGEDMYDWWSWLVLSLHPSDLTSNFSTTDTATDQHT
ncbi:uncharacterized protein SPSC_02097 [Sporisorium scitamineum]|uniref:Xylanolytic transcriptional activator regulatory domain-containing protein n=2 Tax=Sporisorium scitamineum TaxID=49012 RepID=A0A127ZBG2_9BASI|nr:uncharacterized protein SPSC_02097 [Sporisorium scitamineum]